MHVVNWFAPHITIAPYFSLPFVLCRLLSNQALEKLKAKQVSDNWASRRAKVVCTLQFWRSTLLFQADCITVKLLCDFYHNLGLIIIESLLPENLGLTIAYCNAAKWKGRVMNNDSNLQTLHHAKFVWLKLVTRLRNKENRSGVKSRARYASMWMMRWKSKVILKHYSTNSHSGSLKKF